MVGINPEDIVDDSEGFKFATVFFCDCGRILSLWAASWSHHTHNRWALLAFFKFSSLAQTSNRFRLGATLPILKWTDAFLMSFSNLSMNRNSWRQRLRLLLHRCVPVPSTEPVTRRERSKHTCCLMCFPWANAQVRPQVCCIFSSNRKVEPCFDVREPSVVIDTCFFLILT